MTPKYYFNEFDDERCYLLRHHLKYMVENNLKQMTIFEAERETEVDYFHCKKFGEIGEKGMCGKDCSEYRPRNGKSGICNHTGYCYEMTNRSKLITINQIKTK